MALAVRHVDRTAHGSSFRELPQLRRPSGPTCRGAGEWTTLLGYLHGASEGMGKTAVSSAAPGGDWPAPSQRPPSQRQRSCTGLAHRKVVRLRGPLLFSSLADGDGPP